MRAHVAIASLLAASLSSCGYEALPNLDDATRDYSDATPAFPGAVGFGADAVGGRGGQVLHVTNLSSSGPGSLAAALDTAGPRVVVFEVGGVIDLEDNLSITHPYLTIAGQTAPSPGITLTGGGLEIRAPEVIVRHLRIRPGDREQGAKPENRDAIAILGNEEGTLEVYNVLIDHCSLSWGVDETFSTWYRGVHDVSLTNTLISESLDASIHPQGDHSKALLIGDSTRRFSMLYNVLAHNHDRNPIIKGDASALMVNNLVYDPGRWPLTFFDETLPERGPSLFTAIGNHFVRGPSTPPEHMTVLFGENVREGTRAYLEDTIGLDGTSGDPWAQVDNRSGVETSSLRASSPPVWLEGLDPWPADSLLERLPRAVGARPLDRDAVDSRTLEQLRARTGRIIDSQDEVGGFPRHEPTSHTLDLPEDPSADPDGDGLTALDDWLDAAHRDLLPSSR